MSRVPDLAPRIRNAALLEGDFVLSSGERSSFYVDKYLFSTEPNLLRDVADALAAEIPGGVERLAGEVKHPSAAAQEDTMTHQIIKEMRD